MIITLIAGRTATGKDTLAQYLTKYYDWKFLKSYSTRPKRSKDEDTHIFITQKEADEFPKDQIAAHAVINGYTYFSSISQLVSCDGYVIDPDAIYKLVLRCPYIFFQVVYLSPVNENLRLDAAVYRSDNPSKEVKKFYERSKSEDDNFSKFEQLILDKKAHGDNWDTIYFTNDYSPDTMKRIANNVQNLKCHNDHLSKFMYR